MDPMTVELTVHRIGGPDVYERNWGPWIHTLNPGSVETVQLEGRRFTSQTVRVEMSHWTYAMPEWLGFRAMLTDMNGRPLAGWKPCLVYDRPTDKFTYSNFYDPDTGMYALGIRRYLSWLDKPAQDDETPAH